MTEQITQKMAPQQNIVEALPAKIIDELENLSHTDM